MTSIEWTEATWNPIAGCSVLSPGCTHCYAMRTAARLARIEATAPIYAALTQPSKAGPVWTGNIAVNEKALLEPLRRRKPTMYFVNSMSDLFHESVPDQVIDRVFAVMALCAPRLLPNGERREGHTFQILTKRSERMRAYLSKHRWHLWAAIGRAIDGERWRSLAPIMGGDCTPLPNVWLGVSVEDQKRADERIPDLLATPAAVRFLSCEPLLGPVDLTRVCMGESGFTPVPGAGLDGIKTIRFTINALAGVESFQWQGIDWVIAGGENGPRPMHPYWPRSLRDQCAAAGVPFFFKQWGSWAPVCEMSEEQIDACYHPASINRPDSSRRLRCKQCVLHSDGQRFDGEAMYRLPAFEQGRRAMTMFAIGKKAAGRLLDGVTHDAMPQVQRHG